MLLIKMETKTKQRQKKNIYNIYSTKGGLVLLSCTDNAAYPMFGTSSPLNANPSSLYCIDNSDFATDSKDSIPYMLTNIPSANVGHPCSN